MLSTCDELRDSVLSPAGVECADTIDSDRALREEWNKNLKQSQRKSDSTSNKKVSFLESLEKDFKDFDQDGIPTRHANGELVSKSLRKKIKKKLKRRER